MSPRECGDDERILRAIRTSDWDPEQNRYSSNLFTGPDISVSRLSILHRKKIRWIFQLDLDKPPKHALWQIGEISVGGLKQIGLAASKNAQRIVTVVPDPICGDPRAFNNRAHALVNTTHQSRKFSRGLALKAIDALQKEVVEPPTKIQVALIWFLRKVKQVTTCMQRHTFRSQTRL